MTVCARSFVRSRRVTRPSLRTGPWASPPRTGSGRSAIGGGVAGLSPRAVEIAKAMIQAGVGEDQAAMIEALGSAAIAATADKAEGVAAFRAKRKPEFPET